MFISDLWILAGFFTFSITTCGRKTCQVLPLSQTGNFQPKNFVSTEAAIEKPPTNPMIVKDLETRFSLQATFDYFCRLCPLEFFFLKVTNICSSVGVFISCAVARKSLPLSGLPVVQRAPDITAQFEDFENISCWNHKCQTFYMGNNTANIKKSNHGNVHIWGEVH